MKKLCGLLLCCVLMACSRPQPFQLTDITGADFAQNYRLQTATGQSVTQASYQGKVQWLFFGYAHCPDVCPTTLNTLAHVYRQLTAAEQQQVQVLLVTLDPARDTPQVLAPYVRAFHPAFMGLTGSPQALAQVQQEFKVVAQKNAGDDPRFYTLDHTASVYVLDAVGRPRLIYSPSHTPAALLADTRRLLQER